MAKKKTDVAEGPVTTEPVPGNAPAEAPVSDTNGTAQELPTEVPAERPQNGSRRRPDVSYKVFSDRTTVLEVAIWENEVEYDGRKSVQHSIALSRSYKNGEGQWVPSHSYRAHDLPLVRFLLEKAHYWCADRRTEDSTCPI